MSSMSTNADSISVVLSGGTVNINPNDSIGGDPSSTPVLSGVLNNLFDDVSPEESRDGYEDYRCIYFFNDGDTTVYSIKVWIYDDFSEGAEMELGVENRDETQRITLSGAVVTGGSLTLSYKGQNFVSNYNADLGVWATELQDTLNNLSDGMGGNFFGDVSVVAQNAGADTVIFDIRFSGEDGKRNHDKFEEVSNDLTPLGNVDVFITVPQEGAPINTIAAEINLETTPPGGVGFFAASETTPIELPKLAPDEGFPLWVKRNISAGAEPKENDGFILRFSAQSKNPYE